MDLADNKNDQALTQAIIAMGHSLQLKVVAEGVETEKQFEFLKERGCDEVQGFLFSPPLPAEEMAKLLGEESRAKGPRLGRSPARDFEAPVSGEKLEGRSYESPSVRSEEFSCVILFGGSTLALVISIGFPNSSSSARSIAPIASDSEGSNSFFCCRRWRFSSAFCFVLSSRCLFAHVFWFLANLLPFLPQVALFREFSSDSRSLRTSAGHPCDWPFRSPPKGTQGNRPPRRRLKVPNEILWCSGNNPYKYTCSSAGCIRPRRDGGTDFQGKKHVLCAAHGSGVPVEGHTQVQ